MPTEIVTESSADIPPALVRELGITLVPMPVNFGEERLLDGVDLSHDVFYRRLVESKDVPSTSQPTLAHFTDAYARTNPACDIVSIHTAEELSGTINAARQAARTLSPRRVEVIDSRSTSMAMGLVALEAARLAKSGASVDAVAELARRLVPRAHVQFTIPSLEFLARGGRIGGAKRLLGTLLRIQPVLAIHDGKVQPVAQPRTRAHALDALVRFVRDRQPHRAVSVGYSTDASEAEALADRLRELSPTPPIVTRAGPAIATHVGPGFLSVAVLQADPV
jgi:fatty acid kinase fatty acid binding subunit